MPKKGEVNPIKERYWRKQVADCEVSGLQAQEFCRRRNLPYTTFVTRRKRFAQKDAEAKEREQRKDSGDFVPVRVVETSVPVNDAGEDRGIAMEVVLRSGIVLRLTDACSMKLLSSVVSLLGVE
jgi:hypothetical protein